MRGEEKGLRRDTFHLVEGDESGKELFFGPFHSFVQEVDLILCIRELLLGLGQPCLHLFQFLFLLIKLVVYLRKAFENGGFLSADLFFFLLRQGDLFFNVLKVLPFLSDVAFQRDRSGLPKGGASRG